MKKQFAGREKQAKINIVVSLIYQVVAAVVGLVLPRYILGAFGSETNGIVQSVNQMLGYTAILECGIGGMVAASLYKPLAVGDEEAVSDIFNNAKTFFGKLSLVYVGLVFFLAIFSKVIIKTEIDWWSVGSLVFVLGISNFISYYVAISQKLLLRADQKLYITQLLQAAALILNAVFSILLLKLGAGIHIIKIVGALIFLIVPVFAMLYVKKHYSISKKIYDTERSFPKKRDGFAHHISYFIHKNTDIVILTLFCGVKEVSVYSIYSVVVVSIENLMTAISSGIAAFVGNIIALNEKENLNKTFELYNAVNTTLSSFCCTCLALFLIPFAGIYTAGVEDINYIRPIFAYLFVLTEWIFLIRIPFATTITSAGHYKETKIGAVAEAVVNLGLSLILVNFFGMVGVMIGTLISILVRTCYIIWYLSKNIINRKIWKFIVSLVLNIVMGIAIIFVYEKFVIAQTENFFGLFVEALKVSIVALPLFVLLNMIVNWNSFKFIKKK